MPIPDTLPRKITVDFRAEKSMGAEKIFVTLWSWQSLWARPAGRVAAGGPHHILDKIFHCLKGAIDWTIREARGSLA